MISDLNGVLPYQHIQDFIAQGIITSFVAIEQDQVQPASLDLRLGEYAYPVDTSFLSGSQMTMMEKMHLLDNESETFRIDLRAGAVLEKGRVYVIPLLESVALPGTITAFANPKSSTGRLDILTRLTSDYGAIFDCLPAGYKGQLYIEVAPRSFSIVVKTGTRLNQIRFKSGETALDASLWQNLLDEGKITNLTPYHSQTGMLAVSVDLKNDGKDKALIGYRAKKHSRRIHLDRRDYAAEDFWEPLYTNNTHSLILDPSEFYILMTHEEIAVPADFAAEMIAYDTRAGEFRVHYAGFFDPGFGWNKKLAKASGSRAVLEVRSHEVPFLLEHGQTVGWLRYERMAVCPTTLYGQEIQSNYQGQGLKLAKQFR